MANPAKKSTWQNWNQGQDNWADWEPQIRNTWGNLTDDEIEMIENNPDAIYGSVAKRYNWTSDQVDTKMNEISTNITRSAGGRSAGFGKGNTGGNTGHAGKTGDTGWDNQKQAGQGKNNWGSGKGTGGTQSR